MFNYVHTKIRGRGATFLYKIAEKKIITLKENKLSRDKEERKAKQSVAD